MVRHCLDPTVHGDVVVWVLDIVAGGVGLHDRCFWPSPVGACPPFYRFLSLLVARVSGRLACEHPLLEEHRVLIGFAVRLAVPQLFAGHAPATVLHCRLELMLDLLLVEEVVERSVEALLMLA